jgi:CRISPR-associated protein Cas1
MTERIIEIAEEGARLHVRHAQLVIERQGHEPITTPLEELAALVLSHPAAQLTSTVLSGLAEAGGTVVICDRKYLPTALFLPVQAHFVQTERMARQAAMPAPLRKRLWQQIVRAKLLAQARLLTELRGEDGGLAAMAARVRSGDPDNAEARAARIYWPRLFADPHFRRDREAPNQNRHLNYGYAVLRALVSRAVCAAGLHPSLGFCHYNRYNAFCLADDLMEPLRPLTDRAVVQWLRDHDPAAPLDSETRAWLIQPALARYVVGKEVRTLFDSLSQVASSLASVVMGQAKALYLPVLDAVEEAAAAAEDEAPGESEAGAVPDGGPAAALPG